MIKMEKKFIKTTSITDIIISISLIICGSALAFIFYQKGIDFAGYTLIILGIILVFTLKSSYKDLETGERYLKKEFSFQKKMKSSILSAIASSPNSINTKEEGNGLKLIIYYSKSYEKAYIQLFEYVPFQFYPCSKMYEYDINNIKTLIK